MKKKTAKKARAYKLIVVESPAKAKAIKKYLGVGYQVVASNGHIKDLPKSKLGVDVKKNFAVEMVPIPDKKSRVEKIRQLAKGADKIFLASDMDREGEAIAFHLAEEIGRPRKIFRAIFNAVTKSAVKEAVERPMALRKEMYYGQRTRRILDRLVGYKISPILWEKVQRGISAGRVQSVALRLIYERENEIKAFVPEQWFSIIGEMVKNKVAFEVKYYGESIAKATKLTDKKVAQKILADVKGKKLKAVEVKKKERKQRPTPPFTTSKLQQEAAHKLGFTAKRTMMAAQKLYEGVPLKNQQIEGLITYMRTDSTRTSPEAISSVRDYIKKKYGPKYLPSKSIVYKGKSAAKVQDAHEAIRPTNLQLEPREVASSLNEDQAKLYQLIWNKFVASQMNPAVMDQTTISFERGGHFFRANGSVIKFLGFRKVYTDGVSRENDTKGLLPEIKKGEQLNFKKGPKLEEHWTTPPPRYNEASIVKDLEEKGIGRPSTYASIISNIQDRGYVEKRENRFFPTELGMVVCKMLIDSFPDIINVNFTASIEKLLDQIEEGSITYRKVLKDFWKDFEKTLQRAKDEMKNLKRQLVPTGIKCRKCKKGEYHIKWGRNGQFLACSAYPDCNSTYDFKRTSEGGVDIMPKNWFHSPCPTCGKRLEVKLGRYGRFCRCEEYPQCDTTLPYTLPVNCPKCRKGVFAEKKGRYNKVFYACNRYPDCSLSVWSMPYAKKCPDCSYGIMVYRETKREGQQLMCPECKFKVDWEQTPFAAEEKK